MYRIILCFLACCALLSTKAQQKEYFIKSVVFYNVENLYDTKNDSTVFDDDRTPNGKYGWTLERYQLKIDRIANVLADITQNTTKGLPDIIGLAEVENETVVNDLKNHPYLAAAHYRIIHEDSPDERGIDVALLYRNSSFIPNHTQSRRLLIKNEEGFRDYTRDQLVVEGYMDGDHVGFIVNHWPSRSGGELRSKPLRMEAAQLNKDIIDSLRRKHPEIKVISMGDFNDNPTDGSFKKILRTKGNREQLKLTDLYNPMEQLYKKGLGSLAYRDVWSLFDQFYVSANLVDPIDGYQLWKTGIYDADYLKTKEGKYRGYPWRTYASGAHIKGYADHFPVYLYLVKEKK